MFTTHTHTLAVAVGGVDVDVGLVRVALLVAVALATVGAVALADRPGVRRAYLAGFLAVLVVVNVVGVAALPFMHWHKFSAERPETELLHEFRVVDAAGRELDYDHRATLGVDGVSMYLIHSRMDGYDDDQRAAVAAYLLDRAQVHREAVASRSALHLLRFPPHGLEDTWDELELREYDEFVGVRYYRLELTTSADGTAVESYTETLLDEWTPGAGDGGVAPAPTADGDAATVDDGPEAFARARPLAAASGALAAGVTGR